MAALLATADPEDLARQQLVDVTRDTVRGRTSIRHLAKDTGRGIAASVQF